MPLTTDPASLSTVPGPCRFTNESMGLNAYSHSPARASNCHIEAICAWRIARALTDINLGKGLHVLFTTRSSVDLQMKRARAIPTYGGEVSNFDDIINDMKMSLSILTR